MKIIKLKRKLQKKKTIRKFVVDYNTYFIANDSMITKKKYKSECIQIQLHSSAV